MTIQSDYYLLHNFKVVDEKDFTYQMDTVFLCPYFALVIEIKNIAGRIDYDEDTHQCIRTRPDGVQEGFTNAVDQVMRHATYLGKLLKKLDMTMPVEHAVIFSNTKTIIGKTVPYCPMIHVSGLVDFLNGLYKKHRIAHLDHQSLKRASTRLSRLSVEYLPDLKIDRSKLKKGVLCEECDCTCSYNGRKWMCVNCGVLSKSGYQKALVDYRLLIGETITNATFRSFFGIQEEYIAYYLLRKLKFDSTGTYRNRKYIIPLNVVDRSNEELIKN